jgi:NAD(P)H dehydrogenase (quinone)
MIVITGASGQLGRLVIAHLLETVPASQIIAAARDPKKLPDLAAKGVQVRQADYSQPATLERAFEGAEKVLLISSSEVGQRVAQHQAVIDAAKHAGVKLLAYTSVLPPTRRRWAWPKNTDKPRRHWPTLTYRPWCCATAGTTKTTRPA